MNNPFPFMYPNQPIYQPQISSNDFDKLLSKIEKIENNLSQLEKKISTLEQKNLQKENNHDMYFV